MKGKTASLSSSRETNFFSFTFFVTILLLPTQLGKHFWPDYAVIYGIKIDYLSPTIYLTDILIFLLFVFWVAKFLPKRKILNTKYLILYTKRAKIAILFLGFLLVGIVLAKSPLAGFYGILKLLELSFFAAFTAWFLKKNPKSYHTLLLMFAIGIIAESMLAILQFINQGSIGGMLYWLGERSFTGETPGIANASVAGKLLLRPYATFPHPNVLAGYLVLGMTLIISNINPPAGGQISNVKRALFPTALILGAIALLLTMSRVAILVFLVCVIVALYKKLPKKYISLGVLCFLAGVIILFLLLPHRSFSLSLTDESVSVRKDLLVSGFAMFWQHPIFGVGLNNFLITLPSFLPTKHSVFFLQPVHNIFFLWLAQTGMVGATLAIGFFITFYKRLKKRFTWAQGLLIISLFIFGSVDHYLLTLQQGQLLFAFLVGIMWEGKNHK